MLTASPSASLTVFSSATVSGSLTLPPRAFCGLRSGTPSSCASASAWRTLRPSSTMRFAAASGSGMTGRKLALGDIGLHFRRQFRQPHHVGDVAAALADDLGDVFLAALELVG